MKEGIEKVHVDAVHVTGVKEDCQSWTKPLSVCFLGLDGTRAKEWCGSRDHRWPWLPISKYTSLNASICQTTGKAAGWSV